MASAAAFLFFLVGERAWVGPETSSVMVALRSDFVRGSDVGGLAASSSLSGRARGDGSLVRSSYSRFCSPSPNSELKTTRSEDEVSISYWAQVPFFLALLTPGWLAPPGVQKLFPSEVYSAALSSCVHSIAPASSRQSPGATSGPAWRRRDGSCSREGEGAVISFSSLF